MGDGKTTALLDEICQELPETFSYLNDEQQKVAHPLMLKTAVEVAGPPGNYSSHTLLNDCNFLSFSYHDPFDIPFTGTGKTKTIVELVRALLLTTNLDIIVMMSERNGAINAIAEKFKDRSLQSIGKKLKVIDMMVWMSLITYGLGDSMGPSTKLFTVDGKIR